MILAAVVAGGIATARTHDATLGLTMAGILGFGCFRLLVCWLFLRTAQRGRPGLSGRSWASLHAVTGAGFSLCLGVMGGRVLFLDDTLANLLLTMTGTAYVFGVIVRTAGVPRVATSLIVCTFVPLIVAGALMADRSYLGFSAMMVLFCIASLELARHIGATVKARLMAEHNLWTEVRTDRLTGLANRAGLETHGERLLAQGAGECELILAIVDLDGFKAVNDTHGHAAGDELLRQVGARIKGLAGDRHFAARLGGDEFVVLLEPGTSYDAAIAIADQLVYGIRRPFELGDAVVAISASVGLAPAMAAEGLAALLARADQALYRAKTAGRDQASAHEQNAAA